MQAQLRPHSFSNAQSRRKPIISLTPLIDVVFILLVFFMLASSFLEWRSIAIVTAKPPPATRVQTDQQPLLLSVSAAETRLNGELLVLDALIARLQQRFDEDPQASLKVQPIGDTPLQSVIAVLDQLKLAGIARFAMARDRKWTVPASGDEG